MHEILSEKCIIFSLDESYYLFLYLQINLISIKYFINNTLKFSSLKGCH